MTEADGVIEAVGVMEGVGVIEGVGVGDGAGITVIVKDFENLCSALSYVVISIVYALINVTFGVSIKYNSVSFTVKKALSYMSGSI